MPIKEFVATETRFAILQRTDPDRAAMLAQLSQADADERWRYYSQLADVQRSIPHLEHEPAAAPMDGAGASGSNGKGDVQ
jgi:pyruvate-ferredoxin/flavodoxin oxidoreductase